MRTMRNILIYVFLFAATLSASAQTEMYLGSDSYDRPGAVVFNGVLYCFFSDNLDLNYRTTTGGDIWSEPVVVPRRSTYFQTEEMSGPVGTVFNNRLYVFWTSHSTGAVIYQSMDASGAWVPEKSIPSAVADFSPGVATFNGKLYAFWSADGSNQSMFHSTMNTSEVWTTNSHVSSGGSTMGPTATVFAGKLWGLWKGSSTITYDMDKMWYATNAGTGWSSTASISTADNPKTNNEPSLTTDGTYLYVVYKYYDEVRYKRMNAAGTWDTQQILPNSGTNWGPSATFYNGELYVFYHGEITDKVYYVHFTP
jgi:hypothetical protein